MSRPKIICHMLTSIDGKVTGDFLFDTRCAAATEIYYEINRALKSEGSQGYICGRVTMEGSFTGGWYPDLAAYIPTEASAEREMYNLPENPSREYYAIAFDTKGRLGWRNNTIEDEDPGYGGARIIEVLTEGVDGRYLSYLDEMKIPYLFAGKTEIDVQTALAKLKKYLGVETLSLEGGSVINGSFLSADCVDEISLVQAPLTGNEDSKPLFFETVQREFELVSCESLGGAVVMRYERNR